MSDVVLDVSMSLDGFTAGPNVRADAGMGDGGERLHDWMWNAAEVDAAFRREVDESVGAALVGRRTFDVGVRPWGGTPWAGVPTFVVTHRIQADLRGDNGGTFAFAGLEAAAQRAKETAGDKNVFVLGADVARQLLRLGLLDEIRLHLVPVLLGKGTPLFAGERAELVQDGDPIAGAVTHLRYRPRTQGA